MTSSILNDTQVRLWNRNSYDYREIFNGRLIEIPTGKFIVMDYEEANRFMGKMPPMKRDKHGVQLPESYKWLEMDKEDRRRAELMLRNEQEEKSKKIFACFRCNKEFSTKSALISHVKKEHIDDLADQKTRDELEETDP